MNEVVVSCGGQCGLICHPSPVDVVACVLLRPLSYAQLHCFLAVQVSIHLSYHECIHLSAR